MRTSAKAYTAVNLLCTHQGGELVQTGNQWQCQEHQATFTLAGKNLVGPATTALKRLPVRATASMVTIG
jgi:Rieske Fe-S protein